MAAAQPAAFVEATLVDDVKKKKLTTREDLGFGRGWVQRWSPKPRQQKGGKTAEREEAEHLRHVASEKKVHFSLEKK